MFPTATLPDSISDEPAWKSFVAKLNTLATKEATAQSTSSQQFSTKCEICDAAQATMYCGQDKAHLCAACDESHHSSSKLLMKHARLPVYHSPFQFGMCKTHTTDRYECVCLQCGELLCQLCLLLGSHAGVNDHPIVSTMEAFRLSLTPEGSHPGDFLTGALSKAYFQVEERKQQMMNELKAKHGLVMKAESNHWGVQQALDKQLRTSLDQIERMKSKRLDYLKALRRENLLLLTMIEWVEAFVVHGRLSLPPSLWLALIHRVTVDFSKQLLLNSSDGSQLAAPDTVSAFMSTLPMWVTSTVEINGIIEVYMDHLERQRLATSVATGQQSGRPVITSQFEWVPPPVTMDADPVIANATDTDELRKNRMTARLNELLSKPQIESSHLTGGPKSIAFPSSLVAQPVPLDNVKDFVMQTLAVLAETEPQIPALAFADPAVDDPNTRPDGGPRMRLPRARAFPQDGSPQRPKQVYAGSEDPIPPAAGGAGPAPPAASSTTADRLKAVLYGGVTTYGNAVALISAAPSSERQELIRSFLSLYKNPDRPQVEELINAICRETVNNIEASSFLVSGVSTLVPLTATFMLAMYPMDATFLDGYLNQLTSRALAQPDQSATQAEAAVTQFLTTLVATSTNLVFPKSIKFLLQSVHSACLLRFNSHVSLGVVTGLFLARIVSPRLVWSAPKSSGDIQAPQVITLMTRYLHRMAGAAAEGQTALTRSEDAAVATINGTVSQVNALLMREVLGPTITAEERLPESMGGVTPQAAAATIEKKIREYGQGIAAFSS